MPDVTVRVVGLQEIETKLRTLKLDAEKRVLGKGVKAATTVLAEAIQARTPVDKGLLRASVGTNTRVDPSGEAASGIVGFGRQGYIARFVEYGHRIVGHKPGKKDTGKRVPPHPFIRPAFDESAGKALQAFEDTVTQALDNVKGKSHI